MKTFTRKQLEEESGVKARNIRYYIASGLLHGAHGHGRGSCYTKKHLKRLKQIVKLQKKGLTLEQIRLEAGVNILTAGNWALTSNVAGQGAHEEQVNETELKTHMTTTTDFVQVGAPTSAIELTIWDHHWLTDDVQVLIRRDLKSKARNQIAKALRGLATTLEEG